MTVKTKLPINLRLPDDVIWGDDRGKIIKRFSNLGLLYNKYPLIWTEKDKLNEAFQTEFVYLNDKGKKEKVNLKHQFLNELVANVDNSKSVECTKEIAQRQSAIIKSLQSSGWHVETVEAKTDSRLIIGLGGTSVIETGMTLHPLYGFPYLPGSGLKGLARAYAEIAEVASKEELHVIFGSDNKNPSLASENIQGRVFFMDGLPTSFPKLELDIMNPHYGDYYSEKKDSRGNLIPPADYLNPVPVTFLAVAAGQQFTFGLYSRDKELVAKAKEWLIGGLTQLGAGGKTNVGYGYFRIDTDRTQPVISKEQSVESKRIEHIKDNSLTTRLKTVINPQTFIEFIKSIKPDEIEELRNISFKDSGINIGYAGELGLADVTEDIKKLIAAKILEITTPNKKWDEKKHERYRKLQAIAGLNNV